MPWEDVVENSNSENSIPTFWDGVDIKPKKEVMALIDCPHCQKRLRVPVDYSGRLTCPSCSKAFDRQNGENICRIYDDSEACGGEVQITDDFPLILKISLFLHGFSPLLKLIILGIILLFSYR